MKESEAFMNELVQKGGWKYNSLFMEYVNHEAKILITATCLKRLSVENLESVINADYTLHFCQTLPDEVVEEIVTREFPDDNVKDFTIYC